MLPRSISGVLPAAIRVGSRTVIACALASLVGSALAAGSDVADYWIRVTSDRSRLELLDGEKVVRRFDGISLGQAGASEDRVQGDYTTPKGAFQITRINHDSPFEIFIELNYPTPAHAERALDQGVIDKYTYYRIVFAHKDGVPPPQNTPLGGHIGIHGVGRGDNGVHQAVNWTRGCIALTNEQIDELARYARPGMRVEIR
jgi:murein L,D-transpeptidase YafK